MNNLHRELAPISDAAWSEIEEETTRTLKRYLAGRRVVDVPSPGGIALPGVATGHLRSISPPAEGIVASQREVKPLVELRVPFELSHQAIDDVERGSDDSDWQPAKDAAKKLAFAEDRAIFNGYAEADIEGIGEGASNPIEALPADVRDYPDAVAHALSQLRLVGVNGPYSVLLGADEYTAVAEARDYGYPVLEHLRRIDDGELIWAPALAGAFVLTTRGGDFDLHGDGMLVEFASVVDAVRCAVAVQQAMPERDAGVAADSRIELRIGINLGDVIVEGDDLYGDGVNIAARIEALADAGGVFVSHTVHDQVRDRLPFVFDDLGEQQVKNIARPVRVYRVRPEGPLPHPPPPPPPGGGGGGGGGGAGPPAPR